MARFILPFLTALILCPTSKGDPPAASYLFPAGGKQGETVPILVGGLNLHGTCNAEILGPGVTITPTLKKTNTLWFEGPLLPLPDSQRQEDYPRDMAGQIKIDAAAPPGPRYLRLSTSQGATPHLKFLVGELPEIVEEEHEGDPIPVPVSLPLTINGRIFPRGDVDAWSFHGKKDRPITLEVHALRLGSPLEARLEVRDNTGRRLAESDLPRASSDVHLRFVPPADAAYTVLIHDLSHAGSQSHVYRLTLTEGPFVDRVFPLGGKKGTAPSVEITGQGFAGPVALTLPKDIGPAWLHLEAKGQRSNPVLFDVDELEEIIAGPEKNAVRWPVMGNGRISRPGQVDAWTIAGKKGDVLEMELRAARLGSLLDGVLTVTDSMGKEIGRAEAGADGDPSLRVTLPVDGTYTIGVRDRFRSRGGPAFAYRLRIAAPSEPNFRLYFKTDGLTLPRGGQAKLPITIERRGNFQDAITLAWEGLPRGVTVTPAVIPAKANTVEATFKADGEAMIGPARLRLRGTGKIDGKEVAHLARLALPPGQPSVESLLLGVALPTPFKIKGEYDMRWAARGSVFERKYQIERTGYDGPITVSLADKQARHLQGVTGPTITVPAGAAEFVYPVTLPPWMETGRTSRTCVMGIARVKDKDGTEHEVSFSSVQQNEQLVAVVEPGKVGLSLEKGSLLAVPGENAVIAFQLARGLKLVGPAKVEVILPGHFRGIRAEAATVPGEEEKGVLKLHFGKELSAILNMPITVRATIQDDGRPVMAEARLELVRGK